MAEEAAQTEERQPFAVSSAAPPIAPSTMMGVFVACVAVLYFGRAVFVPLALSILLSFALNPIVSRLRRWGLGRVPAVLGVVVLVFVILTGFAAVVGTQVVDLADNVTIYQQNIREKIRALRGNATDVGVIEKTSEMVRDLTEELRAAAEDGAAGEADQEPAAAGQGNRPRPIPVEVVPPQPSPLQVLSRVAGPLLGPIGMAGVVLIFVIFILLQREDLRDRMIRLVGSRDLYRTTEALDDAAYRVSRYLLMQLVINTLYGVPVGIGLWLIGVPNPVLWGLLATVLRFIPYIGPVIAAMFPIALSFAVAPGWTLPLMTIALFVALELFSNNVLEPWLYGSSTGMSPIAILVAAVFWTTLWGPIGLLLSTPLTVCLVVLGRHVPQLRFLDVMFGNEPVLPGKAKFYQRILAHDPLEAVELAEEFLEDHEVAELYDTMVIPALGLAEQDRRRGALAGATQREVAEGTISVIDDLAEHEDAAAAEPNGAAPPVPDAEGARSVLCIGARNDLDMAAAATLADLLNRRRIGTEILPCEAISARNIARLGSDGVRFACLFYLNPAALPHARRLVRRLRRRFGPDVGIALVLWMAQPEESEPQDVLETTGADLVFTTVRQAARGIADALRDAAAAGPSEPPRHRASGGAKS